MFVDETKTLYFRRPSYSPDGSLFICPAGTYRDTHGQPRFASYVFRSSMPAQPVLRLPARMTTISVRFSPQFYAARTRDGQPLTGIFAGLRHRMVYAVVTKRAVLVYDTHQAAPLAVVAGTHKAALTDAAWSRDGRVLVVSSEDGYCSSVHFGSGELGTPIASPPLAGGDGDTKADKGKGQAGESGAGATTGIAAGSASTTTASGSSSQDGFATRHPPIITNTASQPADIGEAPMIMSAHSQFRAGRRETVQACVYVLLRPPSTPGPTRSRRTSRSGLHHSSYPTI
ncbi:hypothetical protein PTSG_09150 [Salpingoeca rosetta]|uniref:CAF1B/HIR1 beta-propeller domain-containing protein n=1 Tax=Salpingoeca rosetta (strain ATCC 50818 / BSB-021) TaxID=946362 RepID=F2UMV6_SALR5|nr:uncharacterized protein PTSG_09150 [Salpingoeca rosetta]EGD78455.1 hypothetical protein PTSG_09150 [Salpingoeca rosetta]|eukprot:XP_004989404.1 hypothetical protein PTSG_09150 [Salpingoeca rosetta]